MSIAILPSNAILHLPSPRVCHEECSIGNSHASRVVQRQDSIRVQVMPQEEETLSIPVLPPIPHSFLSFPLLPMSFPLLPMSFLRPRESCGLRPMRIHGDACAAINQTEFLLDPLDK